MTDRQQQKPLQKLSHPKNHHSQLTAPFDTSKLLNLNKQQINIQVKSNMNKNCGTNRDQYYDQNHEIKIEPENQQNQEKIQAQDHSGIKDHSKMQESFQSTPKSNEEYDEVQQQAEDKVQSLKHEIEQENQQVFISPVTYQPSLNEQNEQRPIEKKNLSPRQPVLIPQEYNKIKYTYNEMQDEEIALSSASIIISQHFISAQDAMQMHKHTKEKEAKNQEANQENMISVEGLDSSESIQQKLQGSKNNQNLQQKHVTSPEQLQQPQKVNSHTINNYQQPQHVPITEPRQNLQPSISQTQQQPIQLQNPPETDQTDPKPSNQSQIQQQDNHSQQKSPSHQNSQPQSQQYNNQLSSFNLHLYKSLEPILQQLLAQLKNILKNVKSDNHNYTKNKTSKFFHSQNPKNHSKNKLSNKNTHTLLDIMQRRKHQELNSNSDHHDPKFLHNHTHQQLNYNPSKEPLKVPHQGNKPKPVPYGLGNLGNPINLVNPLNQLDLQTPSMDISRLEQEERQRLIINRNKINQILASSVSNFKKPESQKNKLKSTSYISRKPQPFNINDSHQRLFKNDDVSFIIENQTPQNKLPNSRKIIRSTNFSKLNNRQPQSEQVIPSSSSKNTIEHLKQKAFFLQRQLGNDNLPTSVTILLKIVKKYLQVIAEGKIDDIEIFLSSTGQAYTNINELINRKKLFKTSLYFERASIVAGICYGYLMITEQRGYLAYQIEETNKQNGKDEANSKQPTEALKEQTKQVLKYMINLASFSLNNCKLISKTIEDHLLGKPTQSITQSQNKTSKSKPTQHQLIQKQIYKRNIETIKLNVQYTQETLHKLFSDTLAITQKLALDQDFGQSFKNVSRLVQKHSIQQSFYTLLQYFSFYLCLIKRQRSIPFLAVAPNPYLDTPEKYTLVIDFISVFCYGTKKSKSFVFRPYSQHFLWQMSQYFDIVALSDALPEQIDKIIDLLDTKGVIKHRLYKYHMVEEKITGRYIKSLERIGRDMDKIVLLDVEANRVTEQTKNTIFINEWKGSKNDSVLAELCSVLLSIVVNRLNCIKATQKIEAQMKLNLANGIKHINFGLDLKESKVERTHINISEVHQGSNELHIQ